MSTLIEPLRVLLKQEVQRDWEEQQEKALHEIRSLLQNQYKSGLGAVLLQDNQPVHRNP